MMIEVGVSVAMIAFLPLVFHYPLQTGDFLIAHNVALVRIGLYVPIFWPTVGYYVYQDSTAC